MFANTPEPPYTAVIFTALRSSDDEDGYAATSLAMLRLSAEQPGYLGIESVRGADGLGISVSYWKTADDARAWKKVIEHLTAQRLGKERWYQSYRVRIAEVTRSYGFDRS